MQPEFYANVAATSTTMRTLIVEDEIDLSRSIVNYLKRENYLCDTADSVLKGRTKIETTDYDCIVLDITHPDGSGFLILKELHWRSVASGVILISGKDSPDDRVAGLNLGADDYLVKPFSLSELHARIASIIRRKRFGGQNRIVIKELMIDLTAKTVMVNQREVGLTRKEFGLLLYFVSNKNRVLSKYVLAENLSGQVGESFKNFEFVYSHVKNLKRKLACAGCHDHIKSIYGVGYRFTE